MGLFNHFLNFSPRPQKSHRQQQQVWVPSGSERVKTLAEIQKEEETEKQQREQQQRLQEQERRRSEQQSREKDQQKKRK